MSTDEEKLKHLRKTRGGHKAFATKISKESQGLIANSNVEGDELEQLKDELETNLQILKERIAKIQDFDEQILALVQDTDTDAEILEAGDYHRILKVTVALPAEEIRTK